MKKRLIFIAAMIGLLASCSNPSGNHPNNGPDDPDNPDNKTLIVFNNTQGICAASVYEDYRRREEDKIVEVPAGGSSEKIEYTPGNSVPFYFMYRINLKGVSGFALDYVPREIGKDQKAVRIDEGATTIITIPRLDETVSTPDDLLSDKCYLLIQNNSSFSFQLHRGASILSPDNLPTALVNSGERAQYTINPGAASPYQLLVGADYKAFSGSIISFEAGHIYSFVFDSNVLLITEVEIKLENVAGVQSGSVPETPGAPAVTASDGLLTLHWTAVQGAEQYEVYRSTAQQPPASPEKTVTGTTTVLTGLVNKTVYYIWIKAVNSSGSSDYSPSGRGIPWPLNEIPAVPVRPVIIPGINQLTVNWEECGGAVSYEVYINTSPVSPYAPEITTDKTSAVIINLENNQIYYIWVRAVNGAGKSNYSPLESGTPKIPTAAPAAPARPVLTAGSRKLTVSWQAVELAASYEVWLGTANNTASAVKQGGDVTGGVTETVISGLVNETVYYVWVRAKNNVGTSGFSPSTSAKPSAFAVLPETPETPAVTVGNRELGISWPPVEGALSYEVWAGVTNNTASAEKYGADVSGTSVTLTGLTNGTTYYLWIKAKNNIGASEFSPRASGTPSAFAAVPSAPQTAPTVIAGSGQLTVSWQTAEGANSYEVWAGTDSNPTIATKRGGDVTGLSSVITGLTNGTTYYVWIKAKNAAGVSSFSPMASGTPQEINISGKIPTAPAVENGNEHITLTWQAVEGATAYEVWIGTVNDSASAAKNGADVTASLSATISGLTNGTTYYIWLKAKNNISVSGFSSAASGKPIADATAPTLSASNGQLSVTWAVIAGAEQYEVFYGTGINPPQSAAQTVNAPTTTATISGLVNGTTYNVWVRGKNSTGTGAISGYASAKPVGNMGTVTLMSGNGQLTASWSGIAGADQYEVYYSTSSSIPGSPVQTVATTTATISSLTNGTTYYVWVKPKNANGAGMTNAAASGVPVEAPDDLTVSAGNGQITVSWAAVPGANYYEVYYSTTATMPGSPAFTVVGLMSRTITGLSNGTTYNFWVKAVNAGGAGGTSPMASGKPIADMGAVTVTSGNGQITLSWTAVAGADQYEVYYDTANSIPASPARTVSATTAAVGSLVNGTTYYFWVKPKNPNGAGSASAAASGKPLGNMGTVTLSIGGSRELILNWTAVAGADQYEVYYGTAAAIPASPALTVATTTATIGGLTNGTTYYVWVKGKNANGTSSASAVASGRPIDGITLTLAAGSGQVSLSWTAAAGADQYEVYYGTTDTIPASPALTIATTTATIGGLVNGTTYYFWVKGRNVTGTGNAGTAVGKPLGTPGAPTVSSGYKSLLVTWTATAGADEYEVYYGTSTPTTFVSTTTGTTATIWGLTADTIYYVRLRAKNANGISDYGPSTSGIPNNENNDMPSSGLYRGAEKIGTQNLAASLAYISSNAVNGDYFCIILEANESVSPQTLGYSGKTVGIILMGYGSERTISLNTNGSMFTVNEGVTLTLDENITLRGRNSNNKSLVYIGNGGKLIVNDGAKISANYFSWSSSNPIYYAEGGGVYNTGTFTMNGGTISSNSTSAYNSIGGGVYNTGTFTMNGGTISGNTATTSSGGSFSCGGGVHNTGTFTMSGGTISGNTVSSTSSDDSSGGGVSNVGTFTMSGGTISGNTASGYRCSYGGGVYVQGTFTMTGGEITGNTVRLSSSDFSEFYGGGVYILHPMATFITKTGGTITGYASDTMNGNVVKNSSGVVQSNRGHAVYVSSSPAKRRETTAGPEVNLDSSVSGAAGGWE